MGNALKKCKVFLKDAEFYIKNHALPENNTMALYRPRQLA